MNATPHTHKIRVVREWEYNNSGCYKVVYGDTKVKVHRGPFLDRRMKRGMKRVVAKHDRGTRRGVDKATQLERYNAELQLPAGAEAWGSDLLKPKRRHWTG